MTTLLDRMIANKGAPATLYAPDGSTVAQADIWVYVTNSAFVKMFGTTRGDVLLAYLPADVPVQAGQVLRVPSLAAGWYVAIKPLQLTHGRLFARGASLSLLALPYTASVTRLDKTLAGVQNGYGEPRTSVPASLSVRTIRLGFSNDNDPVIAADMGALPRGIRTAYTPLGSDVQLKDHLALPDGHVMVVQQKNAMDADGSNFAYQLLLDEL